jgi:Tol biopolymer transport system component
MSTRWVWLLVVLGVLTFLCCAPALAALTKRVSVSSGGEEGLGESGGPAISADGRFVAFNSRAANLVPGDTNGARDVFVHDRETGDTERVSVSTDEQQANGGSSGAVISDDGRYVVFESDASNLVADDTNGRRDIFLRDRQTGTAERVSLSSSGLQIAGNSFGPSISRDCRYVLFGCDAPGVVPEDTNDVWDHFLRDRDAGTTECVTVDNTGKPVGGGASAISDDGRFVTFVSDVPGIVPTDTNDLYDVFVRDRVAGTTRIVSGDNDGQPIDRWCGRSLISADGRFVAFNAFEFDLVGWQPSGPTLIYIRDLQAGTTEIMTASDRLPALPLDPTLGWFLTAATPDLRFVVFESSNPAIVAGDTNARKDVFVRDRTAGQTVRVSVSSIGMEGNSGSGHGAISADGRCVAFVSAASDLVGWDTNDCADVFVRNWQTPSTFADVPPDHWAWAPVEICVERGVTSGYGDGLYRPGEAVSRAQMAAYISRAMARGDRNVPQPSPGATASFPDVPESHWAHKYVEYAAQEGIVTGYADGMYGPDVTVNRAQMAVFIARATYLLGADVPMDTAPDLFDDVPAGYWAGTAIEACVENGIVRGYRGDSYAPELTVSRDQMAVFIARGFWWWRD